jgi:hypothetical protein
MAKKFSLKIVQSRGKVSYLTHLTQNAWHLG